MLEKRQFTNMPTKGGKKERERGDKNEKMKLKNKNHT
jgi:hypothetical protein